MKPLLLSLFTMLTLFGKTQERPNIIIITTDQQFADVMSCRMGDKWLKTPAMDRLASNGVSFTRSYSPNPLCVPARNAIVTGRYPHTTGIEANEFDAILDEQKFPSLGTYFKNAGYETAYFGKWHLAYDTKQKEKHGFEQTGVLGNKGKDAEIAKAGVAFLNEHHTKPFLLFLSFANPHDVCQWARFEPLPDGPIAQVPDASFLPPLRLNAAPAKDESDAVTLARTSYQRSPLFNVGNYNSNDWQRLVWGYYRLVEKVDSMIGEVTAAIAKNDLGKNTVILFTSDHGESMGAHGFNQKTVFFEEATRVPFILNYKGKITNGKTDKLVNTGIDILPTLLEFANIPIPKNLPGKSLKDVAFARKTATWREYIVSENFLEQGVEVNGQVPKIRGRMVRSDRYKYCLYDQGKQREELFDLEKDPGETTNIAVQPASRSVLLKHRNYLQQHASENNDTFAASMLQGLP